VVLVIKSKLVSSVEQQVSDYRMVEDWVKADSRIRLINEIYTKDQMLDLIHCCDAYASLHRAEGFGLGMAEAMKMGKAVIATNYSGNTDFTLADNACLVDYTLQKVGPEELYYLQGNSVWADADVAQAADYMRRLVEDEDYRKRIGEKARSYMDENHSSRQVGERYRRRLQLIGLLPGTEKEGGIVFL
jgi:glycosyltransferase involved in cell wall biosynthesis